MKETKFKQTVVQTKEGSRHCERSEAIQGSFKMTEVGLIPNDWEVKPFKNVATLINGRAYSQSELLERGKYRVLRVGNFGTNDSWYYSNLELPEKMYCNKGDLLYCWSCTYGAYIWDEEKTIYHYHIWKIADLKAEKRYLQYILNNDVVQQMNSSNGSTMSHITKGFLENRLFAFPPTIKEQQRIANALSDVDTLIANLEKLIAKKKNIKQGAMQQLLTGKKRLPGFAPAKPTYKQTELGKIPTDWEVKKIGDFCKVYDGTHQTPHYVEFGIPFYSVENVSANDFEHTKFISNSEYEFISKRTSIEKGDVLMTRIGSIGVCKYVDWDCKSGFYVSLALLKCNEKIDARYLCQQSKSEIFKKEIELHSLTTAIPQKINLGPISQVRIIVPSSKEEQTAIANALNDMDTEIATLETKLAKYRKLKTGMMQQLLTGKIRLIK